MEKRVKELLSPVLDKIDEIVFHTENEVILKFKPHNLAPISIYLFRDLDCELFTVVCTDERVKNGNFKIKYIYSYHRENLFFVLEIETKERFPSLSKNIPALNWYEREIKDLFGIEPQYHPDPRPLVKFPENFPYDEYPLRKDYPWNKRPEFKKYGDYPYKKVEGEGVFNILVGPIHAGVIEPGHFRFHLAGEPIIQLEIRHFWKHRGVEKIGEGKSPEELLNLADKISGDHSFAHTLAYVQAVEKLSDTDIPERAKYIRVIFAELERLMCNINDFAWIFQDVGYTFGAQGLFVVKEEIMRLNKALSGSRFNKNVLRIGGVNVDLDKDKQKLIKEKLKFVEEKYNQYKKILFESATILERLENTGRIKYETVKDLSALGYTARASGLSADIRKEHPYLVYDNLEFESKVFDRGDVLGRLLVRMADIEDSISIIRQCLPCLTGTELYIKPSPVKPDTWALGYAEGQRGNIVHYVQTDEEGKIFRWKVRDPSFHNWQTIQFAVLGDIIADFPLVNKSLNLSYAGNDL